MRSMFEESTPDPIDNHVDSVSPVCDSATDKVRVCLCCVCNCLVGGIFCNFGPLHLPFAGHTLFWGWCQA